MSETTTIDSNLIETATLQEDGTVEIKFISGRTRIYNVGQETFKAFVESDNPTQFFQDHIRPAHQK